MGFGSSEAECVVYSAACYKHVIKLPQRALSPPPFLLHSSASYSVMVYERRNKTSVGIYNSGSWLLHPASGRSHKVARRVQTANGLSILQINVVSLATRPLIPYHKKEHVSLIWKYYFILHTYEQRTIQFLLFLKDNPPYFLTYRLSLTTICNLFLAILIPEIFKNSSQWM